MDSSTNRALSRLLRRAAACVVASLLVIAPAAGESPAALALSTPEQLGEDLDAVPCKNGDRRAAVVALFRKVGAEEGDVSVEKLPRVENVVVRKPGRGAGTIVVGAHYDKATIGCGAVDNWSGVVAVAHLYRTLKDHPTEKSILFVAFGREEEGLVGSKAMVKVLSEEARAEYCAMINFDSLGMGRPQAARNLSSASLMKLTGEVAEQMKIPYAEGRINGDSDSSAFKAKGIPAITIHGLAAGYEQVIHTGNDQRSKVLKESVYLGYALGVGLLVSMDSQACGALAR